MTCSVTARCSSADASSEATAPQAASAPVISRPRATRSGPWASAALRWRRLELNALGQSTKKLGAAWPGRGTAPRHLLTWHPTSPATAAASPLVPEQLRAAAAQEARYSGGREHVPAPLCDHHWVTVEGALGRQVYVSLSASYAELAAGWAIRGHLARSLSAAGREAGLLAPEGSPPTVPIASLF